MMILIFLQYKNKQEKHLQLNNLQEVNILFKKKFFF